MALDVNQFYDGSTVLEPLSRATELPIDQVCQERHLPLYSVVVYDVTGTSLSSVSVLFAVSVCIILITQCRRGLTIAFDT